VCCRGPAPGRPGIPFGRRFATREERIAQLKGYQQRLEGEAEAVREHIATLEAADWCEIMRFVMSDLASHVWVFSHQMSLDETLVPFGENPPPVAEQAPVE